MQNGDKQEAAHDPKLVAEPEKAQWQFNPADQAPIASQVPQAVSPAAVNWTASEFIAHDKTTGWYTTLAVGGLVLAVLIFLLTRDWISTAVIVIITVVFGVFAARQPRVLNYALDSSGLHIAEKFYSYTDFKSFSVLEEGGIRAIWLMPLKRFMPSITVYYAPNDEDKILDVLASYLPFEERDQDLVDKLIRKVRF